MKGGIRVEGVKKIAKALKLRQVYHAKGVEEGLKLGGLFIQRESQHIVPVHLGNLRASAFTRHSGSGLDTEVRVGYTASYAVFVHENLNAAHGEEFNTKHADKIAAAKKAGTPIYKSIYAHYRGKGQQAKFLERVIRERLKEIAAIVVKRAKQK